MTLDGCQENILQFNWTMTDASIEAKDMLASGNISKQVELLK